MKMTENVTKHKWWTYKKKSALVKSILNNEIEKNTACKMYDVSEEELSDWINLYNEYGPQALRATKIKTYRSK